MATKKAVTKKTAPKSRDKKGQIEGRDKKGKFVKDNKIKEKWTETTVMVVLNAMWHTLTTDINGDVPEDKNIVRANDIKLLGEICLMHSVSKQRWNEWEDKFAPLIAGTKEINPKYSESVTDRIKMIRWLLECRLNYSGSSMDIFILKNHYDYWDQQKIDNTTKGESINNPFYEFLKLTSASNQLPK